MKKTLTLIISLTFLFSIYSQTQRFNLDFEELDSLTNLPSKWKKWGKNNYYISNSDIINYSGKYSIKISSDSLVTKRSFGGIGYSIPNYYSGNEIVLEGFLKMENVKNGFAGLVLRLDGDNGMVAFDNMRSQKLNGTEDWTKYTIKLKLSNSVKNIIVGGIMSGTGTIWLDNFKIFIDGKDIIQFEKERNISYGINPILIKNVNYFNTNQKKFIKASILIEKGIIKKIDEELIVNTGIKTINAEGNFLIPGLVDGHIHLFQSGGLYTRPDAIDLTNIRSYDQERKWIQDNIEDILKRYLRLGITTVVDVGGPISNFEIRNKYKNSINHPNLFLTGPLISTYQPKAFEIDNPPIVRANTKEEAIKLVKDQLKYKPDFIKIWYIDLPESPADSNFNIVKAAINEAHKAKLKVIVHATELKTAKLALKAGADILAHSIDDELEEDFIQQLIDDNIVYIPTLLVHDNYSKIFSKNFNPDQKTLKDANPYTIGTLYDTKNKLLTKRFDRYKTYNDSKKDTNERMTVIRHENLKKLQNKNIKIVTGTDAGNIGTLHASSYYNEIKAMKRSGLSNLEIILASTINGAKMLGIEDELGSIELNKKADLLLLDQNPIDNINNIQKINLIIKSGNVLKQNQIIPISPQDLVQNQLNAYNARNIEAFLEPFAEDVELYYFPNKLIYKGKKNMYKQYNQMFSKLTNLHCELIKRISSGNTIFDYERVTGLPNGQIIQAVAMYKIVDEKIKQVYFIK